jgi:DNA-binding winged helix-turn-helix (wHTH) protein
MTRPLISYRPEDVKRLIENTAAGNCTAVVGLSNFGKSTMLRGLTSPVCAAAYKEQSGREPLFVYVDCNRMLEMTVQGFYEVILRAILEALSADAGKVREQITALYHRIVEPESTFSVPLAFSDSIMELMTHTEFDVVLLLDEFDEVLRGLEPRLFLNMRALKDRYGERLSYVVATIQRLTLIRESDHVAEFAELFGANELFVLPLSLEQATQLASDMFVEAHDHLDDHERDYIWEMAGGHPGLTQAVAQTLLKLESGAPTAFQQRALSMVEQSLESNRLVRNEVIKLWSQIGEEEREALIAIVTQGPDSVPIDMRRQLLQRGLLIDAESARPFARLFTQYIRRQGLVRQGMPGGIYLDTDAGEVWINGARAQTLTDLEYRLLLLMYGRLEKICDKYQIVEAVWGQEYIDEVDDARIEKLVSRLRAKLEPDPAEPRFLLTVRGRGYKLTNGGSELSDDDER